MKVLVAEDSPVMQAMLCQYLNEWEYDYHVADDGEAAWKEFQSGEYLLVLTDWIMPGIDGLELTRLIRSRESDLYVYVILLTAKSEKVDLVEAMEGGADDFLVKPCDKDELRVRLRAGERIVKLETSLAEQNIQLRETQAALVESEKLASLGQLAAGMAHEINNPISYVSNNISVLQRDLASLFDLIEKYQNCEPLIERQNADLANSIRSFAEACDLPWMKENLVKLLESSTRGIQRVREIILNLRDFARLDEASMDMVDLNSALRSTIVVLNHDFESRNIEVELDFQDLSPVLCRPDKINQLFYSVILNAIQACESGGKIRISTLQAEDGIEIAIADDGVGIGEDDLPHIFEPFFTTKDVGAGTGLGLAVGYGIVRDHGGSIKVESKPSEGTTIRISLPLESQPT